MRDRLIYVIRWAIWFQQWQNEKKRVKRFEVQTLHSSKSGQIVFGYTVGYEQIFINPLVH